MIDRQFWRDRRVLLTGHTGFKGSWLSFWLARLGARVSGFALEPPTAPALFDEAELAKQVEDIRGDVRDPAALAEAVDDVQPDVVIHMAAQSLVRASYEEPVETWATNVMGTVHLLETARATASVKAVVVVTTDKCYESQERGRAHAEDDPLGGHDPYATSKASAEHAVSSWRKSFMSASGSPAIASARAGNVVGGGDWSVDRLFPDLLAGFTEGRPVEIRSPSAVRPWQHVLEPLSGYLLLAQHLFGESDLPAEERHAAQAWNFGPGERHARPVAWVADRMAELWGEGARWVRDDGTHPHEAEHLSLDSSRARSGLGWTPRWSLNETLGRCVAWHRAWLHRSGPEDVRDAMLSDIAAFEASAREAK